MTWPADYCSRQTAARHISNRRDPSAALSFRKAVRSAARQVRAVAIHASLPYATVNLKTGIGAEHTGAAGSISRAAAVVVFIRASGGQHHARQLSVVVVLKLIAPSYAVSIRQPHRGDDCRVVIVDAVAR